MRRKIIHKIVHKLKIFIKKVSEVARSMFKASQSLFFDTL